VRLGQRAAGQRRSRRLDGRAEEARCLLGRVRAKVDVRADARLGQHRGVVVDITGRGVARREVPVDPVARPPAGLFAGLFVALFAGLFAGRFAGLFVALFVALTIRLFGSRRWCHGAVMVARRARGSGSRVCLRGQWFASIGSGNGDGPASHS
jgi:hypothetical protein